MAQSDYPIALRCLAAFPFAFLALAFIIAARFTREMDVCDGDKKAFIHSERHVIAPSQDTIYRAEDIAFVGLDRFLNRSWCEGTLSGEWELGAVWLELKTGDVYSVAVLEPDAAVDLATNLQKRLGVPLNAIELGQSPTRDSWEANLPA